jgi:structure-specific endonuclease subunit SLX1
MMMSEKPSFVYLLEASPSGATYVGATVDVDHRLRQHNKELVGGAHATTLRVQRGERWRRVLYVSGFPDWTAALQFEWRWKQLSRKPHLKSLKPLDRRHQALQLLLHLERPTTKALRFQDWPSSLSSAAEKGPQLHYEQPPQSHHVELSHSNTPESTPLSETAT